MIGKSAGGFSYIYIGGGGGGADSKWLVLFTDLDEVMNVLRYEAYLSEHELSDWECLPLGRFPKFHLVFCWFR